MCTDEYIPKYYWIKYEILLFLAIRVKFTECNRYFKL